MLQPNGDLYFIWKSIFPYSIGVSLLCAQDEAKDQTFFLSQIPQWALQKSVFPLGNFMKSHVKQIAIDLGMKRIAKKKEVPVNF